MTTEALPVPRPISRDETRTLFSQTMTYVAATAGLFGLGAYISRDVSAGWSWLFFVGAVITLIAMQPARARSSGMTVGLLFAFGLLLGAATAPTLANVAATDPQALWKASGATALFVAGFGALGYSTRRDLSMLARSLTWALLGLIVFGLVTVFVTIPNGDLIYAAAGLVIFAGLTAFDFQRLRRTQDIAEAPLLAASIFLDILNVFLLLLSFGRGGPE